MEHWFVGFFRLGFFCRSFIGGGFSCWVFCLCGIYPVLFFYVGLSSVGVLSGGAFVCWGFVCAAFIQCFFKWGFCPMELLSNVCFLSMVARSGRAFIRQGFYEGFWPVVL